MIMCAAVSEEAAASDILVGAQPRIRCLARARSSSSELVDTATARRQQRVEDAARMGLQFPFRSEGRGRGAPSVAMKWRDAVKASIMHGPLPPDVTLDAPHWWLPGMPLLPPADYVAPVPLKRKRDTSAEPKKEHAKRGYRRTPDEAKLWFQGFHANQARVHGKSLAYNIRRAKQLVPELFGPVAPDTFRRWHDSGAPDHRGRPPVDLPPFALSRLANLTHAVAARLSLSVPTWQHVYRRVLRELDIEFEPSRRWTRQFLRSLQLSWKLAATHTRHRPSEADIARERKLLQLRVTYLCNRFGISQDRIWNLDETAVRIVPAGDRGWTKRAEPAHVFASRAFVTVTLAANMRGGMWTQIVQEGKSGRVHRHGPHSPRQLVSHSPTHWITQEALLDMIDAIDADMHARPGDARAHTLAPGSGLCATTHCCGISQHHARHPAAHQTVLRPAELHRIHSAAGPGVHARLQELDRSGQTLRRVLLGSRVQLQTCESGLQHRSAPPAAALGRAHSRTERRQPATSNRWLALHRLERGGAA